MIRNCNICGNEYKAEPRYLKRNQGLTCSRACGSILAHQNAAVKNPKEPNCECANCGTMFRASKSRIAASKSGLFFCSRACKDEAQRIGGIREIMPSHYGTSAALVPEYRRRAFRHYPNECAVCGWNEYPDVLEVNHKNLDRSDNSIENLEILCPTHHQVFHYLDGSGRWSRCVRS